MRHQGKGSDDEDHGDGPPPPSGGNWRVENQRLSWEILDTWADAAAEVGIPRRRMFHDSNAVGSGYFEVNQRGGWRVSSYRAFLADAMDEGKVDVRVQAHCRRILFEEDEGRDGEREGGGREKCARARPRASGVEYVDSAAGNALRTVTARREVILCAGAVGSPHALLLSGLGPHDELSRHGVAPVAGAQELLGVGGNLQDVGCLGFNCCPPHAERQETTDHMSPSFPKPTAPPNSLRLRTQRQG